MSLLTEELLDEFNNDLNDTNFKYKLIYKNSISYAKLVLKNSKGLESYSIHLNEYKKYFIEDWFIKKHYKVLWYGNSIFTIVNCDT